MKAELIKGEEKVHVWFQFDVDVVAAIKTVPGARFNKTPAPHWVLPLDYTSLKRLHELFPQVEMNKALLRWIGQNNSHKKFLTQISKETDADLSSLLAVLPEVHERLRPYQRVGVRWLAESNAPMLADEPGLGKTLQAIAAVFESGMHAGPQLVVAPVGAIGPVWVAHLNRWQPYPVFAPRGNREERDDIIHEAQVWAEMGEPFWLVVNPAMVRFETPQNELAEDDNKPRFDLIHALTWNHVILDECHRAAIGNPTRQTAKAMYAVKAHKRIALSGTPFGGKAINLWGILHFLDPKNFTSRWRWADQWLDIAEDTVAFRGGRKETYKKIGGIKDSRREEFNQHLTPYLLVRTRHEVKGEIPQEPIEMWVDITAVPRQAKQYKEMADEAETKISEDETISATSILAEYTRLKQFSNSYCKLDETGKVVHTFDSAKLPLLMDLLAERGIQEDEFGDDKVVIFTQFSRWATTMYEYLRSQGIQAWLYTGATTVPERDRIQQEFQATGGPRVLVMTTTAGGVAIDLDAADTFIFTDETWNPDDQKQAWHRGLRFEARELTIIFIRCKNTLEEYIRQVTGDKEDINQNILQYRQMGLRATGIGAE